VRCVLPELLRWRACALRLDAADLAAGFDLCLDLHNGFLVRCKSVRWRACTFGLDPAELAAGLDLGLHFHGCFPVSSLVD